MQTLPRLLKTTRLFRVAVIIAGTGFLVSAVLATVFAFQAVTLDAEDITSEGVRSWELSLVPDNVLMTESALREYRSLVSLPVGFEIVGSPHTDEEKKKRLEYLRAKSVGTLTVEEAKLELARRKAVTSWRLGQKRKDLLITAFASLVAGIAFATFVFAFFSAIYWILLPKQPRRSE